MAALFELIMGIALVLTITYGLYSLMSPISFVGKSYWYYAGCILLACFTWLSVTGVWIALKEVLHFIQWLFLYIMDRNPGKYAMIEETKRIKQEQKEWEESEEYKIEEENKAKLEKFYNTGKVSAGLYYLLGKEEGLQAGEIAGIKSTYKDAFERGQSQKKADIEAKERRRREQMVAMGSNNQPRGKTMDEETEENVRRVYREKRERQWNALIHGDKDWFSK